MNISKNLIEYIIFFFSNKNEITKNSILPPTYKSKISPLSLIPKILNVTLKNDRNEFSDNVKNLVSFKRKFSCCPSSEKFLTLFLIF